MTLPLDNKERKHRQSVVDAAFATVGLEGFKPDVPTMELAQRWVSGKVSMEELVAKLPVGLQ
jgi:hypothetical protein